METSAIQTPTILDILSSRLQDLKHSYGNKQYCEVDAASEEWLAYLCSLVGIPKNALDICKQILESKPPTKLIWLHMAECSGCTEELLRIDKITMDSLMFKYISFEYHETLMGASGFRAKSILEGLDNDDFILIVEGGVPFKEGAHFFTSGADGMSGEEECLHLASQASAVFAVGTCSSFGGVQAAIPNPTNSVGLDTFLKEKVVNIPGCPPSEANILASLMYFILLNDTPPLDMYNRPLWSYGKNLHDMCERKVKFDAGDFVQSFDDPNMENGYCLYKVGCKGPYTFNNCPKVKFNSKTSWPVKAGHGCIACSEPNFWDEFGVLEEPPSNKTSYIKTPKILQTFTIKNPKKDSNVLRVDFGFHTPTRIYTEQKDFLNIEFESNLAVLLKQIEERNKLGARLVANYKEWAKSNQVHISESLDSTLSANLSDIFHIVNEMFVGVDQTSQNRVDLQYKKDFLQSAQDYLYKLIGKIDFKLQAGDSYGIEVNKALRSPLCYLLGGLEKEGVAYSVTSSLCEILVKAIVEIAKSEEIEQISFSGEVVEYPIIQDRLIQYMPQWLEVVI